MKKVFWKSAAREDRRESSDPGRALTLGAALLCALTGIVGCGGDPIPGEWDEPVDSDSEALGQDGKNGVPTSILAAGYLSEAATFAANVNSPLDKRPTNLCGSVSYDPINNQWTCSLKNEWLTWFFSSGNPNDPPTKDRYYLLQAMVHCTMQPNVTVQVPLFPALKGMFGMYMSWMNSPLEMHQREVVSACVAAKVNAFGAVVPIGFVGPDFPQPIGDLSFQYQEAAFYGDLFTKQPVVMACSGKKMGGGSYVVGKNLRVCGQVGNPCHVRALGACDAGTFRCKAWAGAGAAEHCVTATDGIGGGYKHPLTVYLQTEPQLLAVDVARCGMSGKEKCDDGPVEPPQ